MVQEVQNARWLTQEGSITTGEQTAHSHRSHTHLDHLGSGCDLMPALNYGRRLYFHVLMCSKVPEVPHTHRRAHTLSPVTLSTLRGQGKTQRIRRLVRGGGRLANIRAAHSTAWPALNVCPNQTCCPMRRPAEPIGFKISEYASSNTRRICGYMY